MVEIDGTASATATIYHGFKDDHTQCGRDEWEASQYGGQFCVGVGDGTFEDAPAYFNFSSVEHDGCFRSGSTVLQFQTVVLVQAVGYSGCQITRIVFLPIRTGVAQR